MVKVPDIKYPEGTHPTFYDALDWIRVILNNGRYQLRIVTEEPDWTADDGELILFDNGEKKYLYMYITDGWYSVTFLTTASGGSGGTRFHHIGEIFGWGGSSTDTDILPPNTIVCNGAAISRSTYSDLFNIIGTDFGSGDGSLTFNVPDLRGRVAPGADNMGGTSADNLGRWGYQNDLIGETGGDEFQDAWKAAYGDRNSTNLDNGSSTASTTRYANGMPPYQCINYLVQA